MAQVITGTSADDSFNGTVEQTDYLFDFTDSSHYNEQITDLDTGETTHFPYDNAELSARVIYSKEGNDSFDLTDKDIEYTVLAGAGDDTVELPSSFSDVEGSYFDGG